MNPRKRFVLIMLVYCLLFMGCQPNGVDQPIESSEECEETVVTTEAPIDTEDVKTEKTTESATAETDEPTTTEAIFSSEETEAVLELEFELRDDLEYFRTVVKEFYKEEDHYVIVGSQIYGGLVMLSSDQRALLDAGAELKLVYQGEELGRITAKIGISHVSNEPAVRYMLGDTRSVFLDRITASDRSAPEYIPMMEILKGSPYMGYGYYFEDSLGYDYDFILEEEVTWIVDGDVVVRPQSYLGYKYQPESVPDLGGWTVDRFYEEAIIQDGHKVYEFEVYTENGEIVELFEPYMV